MSLTKKEISIATTLWIIGAIIMAYLYLGLNVLGPEWGIPWGPQRLLILWIPSVFIALPMAYLTIAYQAKNPEWLAPIGKYVEGVEYTLWNPRRFVEIAVIAALLIAFDSITLPFTGVSLCAIGLIFVSILFGPATTFFSIILAWALEAMLGIGLTSTVGPLFVPIRGLNDGSIYALAAWFYRRYVYGKPPEKKLVWYIAWFAVWNLWHLLLWTLIVFPIAFGMPAAIPQMIMYVSTCYPTNIASGIVGALIAEAAIKAMTK